MTDSQREFSSTTARALVLTKQIFLNALSLSKNASELSRTLAILELDFCVETLLKTVVSELGPAASYLGDQRGYSTSIPRLTSEKYNSRMDFGRVFDEVVAIYRDPTKGIGKDGPPLRREIEDLHDVRNGVQHRSSVPSGEDVIRQATYVESFVGSLLKDAFSTSLNELSISNLIENNELRTLIEQAERYVDADQYIECVIECAKAFQMLVDVQRNRQPVLRQLRRASRFDARRGGLGNRDLEQALENIVDHIEAIDGDVLILSLAIDHGKYERFNATSPRIYHTTGGLNVSNEWKGNPSKQDALESLDFVFSTIVKWESTHQASLPEEM